MRRDFIHLIQALTAWDAKCQIGSPIHTQWWTCSHQNITQSHFLSQRSAGRATARRIIACLVGALGGVRPGGPAACRCLRLLRPAGPALRQVVRGGSLINLDAQSALLSEARLSARPCRLGR